MYCFFSLSQKCQSANDTRNVKLNFIFSTKRMFCGETAHFFQLACGNVKFGSTPFMIHSTHSSSHVQYPFTYGLGLRKRSKTNQLRQRYVHHCVSTYTARTIHHCRYNVVSIVEHSNTFGSKM